MGVINLFFVFGKVEFGLHLFLENIEMKIENIHYLTTENYTVFEKYWKINLFTKVIKIC